MNPRCAEHPLAYKDAVFLSPHKFIGGPGTPGRAGRAARAADQPVPDVAGRRHGRLRQPERARLPRPTRRTARRAARRRSSSRSGPGWCSSSRRPSASTTIRAHEERLRCSGRSPAWDAAPERSRSSATSTPSGSRSCRSSVRRPGGRYLHHNFVVACSTTCSASSRAAAARAPGPYGHRLLGIDLERSHEFEREITQRLRGHQARLGAGQLQLLHLRGRRSDYIVDAVALVADDGWALLPDYRFDPATGMWRHRAGPVEPPLRLAECATTTTACCATRGTTTRRRSRRSPATWTRPGRPAGQAGATGRDGTRRRLGAPDAGRDRADRRRGVRGACAGSTCRRADRRRVRTAARCR